MEEKKDFLLNADIAFNNQQYMEALTWYKKALQLEPNDLYALSRAGAICVALNRYKDALSFFSRAKNLDPTNGDSLFNYGNACFYNQDFAQAFNCYVEAQKLKCSDDVKPRLFYQLGLLCSLRRDAKGSLAYFRKCEESDKTGMMALNPDLISEKLKLYLSEKEFINAEQCAAQLVAIAPTQFKNYMIYFSICMMHKHFDLAQSLLADAKAYAEMTPDDRVTLLLQNAALFTGWADAEPAKAEEHCQKAVDVLKAALQEGKLTLAQKTQVLIVMAEAYIKAKKLDPAIVVLSKLLPKAPEKVKVEELQLAEVEMPELMPSQLEAMLDKEFARLDELVYAGEDLDMLDSALDDECVEVLLMDPEKLYGAQPQSEEAEQPAAQQAEEYHLSVEEYEKVMFLLMTCFMEKDSFENAQKLAAELKHSENKYYGYYGLYVDALTQRKLTGNSEKTQDKYKRALAFFRSKSFADSTDGLACMFRARLYAEQGSYVKAEELARLMTEAEQKVLLAYIETCKQA